MNDERCSNDGKLPGEDEDEDVDGNEDEVAESCEM